MPFRLPFVTRALYDEMKEELSARLAASEEERRRLIDFNHELAWGRPVFNKPSAPKELAAADVIGQTPEQKRINEVGEAMRATGSRNPRIISDWITKKREREWQEKNASPEQAHILSQIDDTIEEGKKAAEAKSA